jgi:NTE family protein
MASLPAGVTAHVLPSGETDPPRYDSLGQLRYKNFKSVLRHIKLAYKATAEYLDDPDLVRAR